MKKVMLGLLLGCVLCVVLIVALVVVVSISQPEKCVVHYTLSSFLGQFNVYLVAEGNNANEFCSYMVKTSLSSDFNLIVTQKIETTVPELPKYCEVTKKGITVEILSDTDLIGSMACNKLK